MMLVEETAPPAAALPVEGLRGYLRLGTGFELAPDAAEDAALTGFLRAAIAAIEARTGKVLLTRQFRMRLEDWREPGAQPLPLAPALSVDRVVIDHGQDGETVAGPGAVRLIPDNQRPTLVPGEGAASLPQVPQRGFVTVLFTAGFGTQWSAIPPDLAQAVIMLAGQYYEDRSSAGVSASLPFKVAALIERWRAVRTLAGRGATRGAGR